jgi:hypothetical protein
MSRALHRRIERLELTPPRALTVSSMTDAELEALIYREAAQLIKDAGSFEAFCKEMESEGEVGAQIVAVANKYRLGDAGR